VEIERKWLVETLPAAIAAEVGTRIEQGYLTSESVKTRIVHPLSNGLVAEIDTFEDRALLLVEVEFTRVEQAGEFVAPAWFGRDVTDDPAYKNRNLAA